MSNESFGNIQGPSMEVEKYFAAWTQTTALYVKNPSVEYTANSIVYTFSEKEDFDLVLEVHENFTQYPEHILVTADKEKLTFTFKDNK